MAFAGRRLDTGFRRYDVRGGFMIYYEVAVFTA
jgi:hypothetical protein